MSSLGITSASIAECGDLDGDGLSELIVASDHSVGIWSGSTLAAGGSLSGDDAEWIISPGMTPDPVAAAGDIDRDGHPELLIGSIDMNQTGYGGAYLFNGSDIFPLLQVSIILMLNGLFPSSESNDYSGCSVSSAGDIWIMTHVLTSLTFMQK